MAGKNRNRVRVKGPAGNLLFCISRDDAEKLVAAGFASWNCKSLTKPSNDLVLSERRLPASPAGIEGAGLWSIFTEDKMRLADVIRYIRDRNAYFQGRKS